MVGWLTKINKNGYLEGGSGTKAEETGLMWGFREYAHILLYFIDFGTLVYITKNKIT